MSSNEKISLYRVGGTVDSSKYDDPYNAPDNVKPLNQLQSLIIPTIKSLGFGDRLELHHWSPEHDAAYSRDSKDLAPEDIEAIGEDIKKDKNRLIVVTIGTDAMAKWAAVMQGYLKGSDKIVVFAGAMVPLSMHGRQMPNRVMPTESDFITNITFTLQHIHTLESGVYIAGRKDRPGQLEFLDPSVVEKHREASKEHLKLIFKDKSPGREF